MARIEILAEATGNVWKVEIQAGTKVEADTPLIFIESMKMEIPVSSLDAGTVVELRVKEGDAVEEGQVVAVMEC
ncbi:MAG: acetyl-CoA carboxylase biotin carboxyl carrier protein subunit [Pseudomonadota bacterium]